MKLTITQEEAIKPYVKHNLKVSSDEYDLIMKDKKRFILCESDSNYKIGDIFMIKENLDNYGYTGRYFIQGIHNIQESNTFASCGLKEGYCILSW